MIPSREIKEKARECGVPESTVERDYVQNWLLKYLSLPNMVLKGGTGIRKVYIEDYRFSDDLDFTLVESTSRDFLLNSVKNAVTEAKEESGINFSDKIEFIKTESGFRSTIYFNLLQRTAGTPISIKIDLTTYGNERVLLPIEEKRILHPYSDEYNCSIKAYSLEEIMAEKIRSLFERTRPRDMYDIWCLDKKVDEKKILVILYEKFKFKGVKLDATSLENRKIDFSNAWEKSLRHQLKELPDFNYVYDGILKQIKEYETNRTFASRTKASE